MPFYYFLISFCYLIGKKKKRSQMRYQRRKNLISNEIKLKNENNLIWLSVKLLVHVILILKSLHFEITFLLLRKYLVLCWMNSKEIFFHNICGYSFIILIFLCMNETAICICTIKINTSVVCERRKDIVKTVKVACQVLSLLYPHRHFVISLIIKTSWSKLVRWRIGWRRKMKDVNLLCHKIW